MLNAPARWLSVGALTLAAGLSDAAAQSVVRDPDCQTPLPLRVVLLDSLASCRDTFTTGSRCYLRVDVRDEGPACGGTNVCTTVTPLPCTCGSAGGIRPAEADAAPVTILNTSGPGDECSLTFFFSYLDWCGGGIDQCLCEGVTCGGAAPGSLEATSLSASRIWLRWVDNSIGEAGFTVERRTADTAYATIASTSADVTSYVDDSVSPTQTYSYRVRAFSSYHFPNGQPKTSFYSNEASVTTDSVVPPAAPTDAHAVLVGTSISVGWTDRSTDEDGFQVQRRSGAGFFETVTSLPADTESYLDASPAGSTTYTYRVRAFNVGGASDFAVTEGVTTPPAPPPIGPTAPCCLTATAGRAKGLFVTLTWRDQSDNETGFRVERRLPGKTWDVIATLPKNAAGSLTDGSVLPSTTYNYRVVAYNGVGSSPSSEITVTTPP